MTLLKMARDPFPSLFPSFFSHARYNHFLFFFPYYHSHQTFSPIITHIGLVNTGGMQRDGEGNPHTNLIRKLTSSFVTVYSENHILCILNDNIVHHTSRNLLLPLDTKTTQRASAVIFIHLVLYFCKHEQAYA